MKSAVLSAFVILTVAALSAPASAAAIAFKHDNDAIFTGNDTIYSLAYAVWTREVSRAHRVVGGSQGGDRVGQLLSYDRYRVAVWWIQATRLRSRGKPPYDRPLHQLST